MKRLADFGNPISDLPFQTLEVIEGKEVTITGAHVLKGQYGDYCFMQMKDEEHGEYQVMCGGAFVLEAIKAAITRKAFPVAVSFERRGRAWLFR